MAVSGAVGVGEGCPDQVGRSWAVGTVASQAAVTHCEAGQLSVSGWWSGVWCGGREGGKMGRFEVGSEEEMIKFITSFTKADRDGPCGCLHACRLTSVLQAPGGNSVEGVRAQQ